MTHITALELKAREMLEAARDREWSPARASIVIVFRACYMNALPVDRIIKIADALVGENIPEDIMKRELTKLVREKTLRRNGRMYEINFSDHAF